MSLFFILILIVATLFLDASATGKPISGEFPKGNRIIKGKQYIYKGAQPFDLDQAATIVEIDSTDNSITLYAPLLGPPDSLYIRFIPSCLFTATLSAEVIWNDQTETYRYQYTIISDPTSITPIGHFEIEWWNDYKQIFKPENWTAGAVKSRHVNYWSSILTNKIHGGDTLSGIGYETNGPPVLTEFELWGEMNTLERRGDDEMFGSIYSGISGKYRGTKGYTIAAWVCPESIEPVEWFGKLCFKKQMLVSAGFLEQETERALQPILFALYRKFQLKENHSLDILEQEINSALTALEPYKNQMEPEAQAYIFENLKYLLRHLDIVKFKYYP